MSFERVLLIDKCPDKLKWYASKVGEFVPLLAEEEKEYKSQEPAGYINFVSKTDATPLWRDPKTGEVRWKRQA